jgi:hypothetical protein
LAIPSQIYAAPSIPPMAANAPVGISR